MLREKPLWKLLADMTPEQLVACVDFRYITDAIAPAEAVELLRASDATKPARTQQMFRDGFPAYTTSAGIGWVTTNREASPTVRRKRSALRDFAHFKLKVGRDVQDDRRRCRIVRESDHGENQSPDGRRQPSGGK